ncbi:hypothetical protein [Pelagerythrobacter marinus]|uniref:hypothetical protein n=1 Tax=Pelagerythrobacter marinus TaxID=538382 RepID=UPI002AC91356|nr:hypothetical protein [Pelagerythrobacter marinus]WPZ05469.1 hypothetical protein T8T98_08480 [Pelagerythrobacter marinus]
MNDFSSATKRALARKGIRVIGLTVIPGAGDFPFSTGERGYRLDDNGCHRIFSFTQVVEAANG